MSVHLTFWMGFWRWIDHFVPETQGPTMAYLLGCVLASSFQALSTVNWQFGLVEIKFLYWLGVVWASTQEIEAAAMAAAGKPEQYEAAASTITALIKECKGKEFENADGVKNDWADRMLGGSETMNESSLAAT